MIVSRPTVSVVVPTYERREYVLRAVRSVLAQTFTDFELIVVDDGSTDGTELALRGLDDRLRYHRQAHRGPAAARNAGIALARGEIVAFLDSDNRWRPNHLAVVTEALARFPAAVVVATCPGFLVSGRIPVSRARLVDALPAMLLRNVVGYSSGAAVRTGVLREVGGFDERLSVFEDTDLWLRVAMRGRFCFVTRRTIVHQATRGGLKHRGVRAGRYVEAIRISAATARELLPGLDRADLDDLEARLEAKELLVEALHAVSVGADETGRRLLAEACALAPRLSREPETLLAILPLVVPFDEDEAVRFVARVADLWPDRRADTPRSLAGYAALRTLRARQPLGAARQVGRAGGWPSPTFLVRVTPVGIRHVRRWLQRRRSEGVETAPAQLSR